VASASQVECGAYPASCSNNPLQALASQYPARFQTTRIAGRSEGKTLLCSLVMVALALGISLPARSQAQISVLCPNPIQEAMDKLVASFEAKTGIITDPPGRFDAG
jgi:hypothetical protein